MAIIRNSISAKETADNLGKFLDQWLTGLDVTDLFRTCVTCSNLEGDRLCKYFNRPPPASVIVTGCEHYDDGEHIPF